MKGKDLMTTPEEFLNSLSGNTENKTATAFPGDAATIITSDPKTSFLQQVVEKSLDLYAVQDENIRKKITPIICFFLEEVDLETLNPKQTIRATVGLLPQRTFEMLLSEGVIELSSGVKIRKDYVPYIVRAKERVKEEQEKKGGEKLK